MKLGMQVGLGHTVLDGDPAPPEMWYNPQFSAHVRCGQMPLGMDVGLGPGAFVRWGLSPPIFGPCLLWPNGWMDQDATSYGDRRHCVRWGPSSPLKEKHSPQISAHVRCGQMSGWIEMSPGIEGGLAQATVLDGDPAPPPKKGAQPPCQFSAHVYCAKWLDGSRYHLVRRRPRPRPHCVRWELSPS